MPTALRLSRLCLALGIAAALPAAANTPVRENPLNPGVTAPTAGVGQGRTLSQQPVLRDTGRMDSTLNGMTPGTPPVNLPDPPGGPFRCNDPTALNYGQIAACAYTNQPPPPSCGAQPPSETRTVACPSGQTGSIVEGRTYASAPAPTCWLPGPWIQVLNNCSTDCGPRPPKDTRTLACPSGQTGSIFEFRNYNSAPAPTCWVAGPWEEEGRTCTVACGPQPPSESRTLSCPSGQSGSIIEGRSYTSAPAPTCWVAGPWTLVMNTCRESDPCANIPQPPDETMFEACPWGRGEAVFVRSYDTAPPPQCWAPGRWRQVGFCDGDIIFDDGTGD